MPRISGIQAPAYNQKLLVFLSTSTTTNDYAIPKCFLLFSQHYENMSIPIFLSVTQPFPGQKRRFSKEQNPIILSYSFVRVDMRGMRLNVDMSIFGCQLAVWLALASCKLVDFTLSETKKLFKIFRVLKMNYGLNFTLTRLRNRLFLKYSQSLYIR